MAFESLFDFEDEKREKGFKQFTLSKQNLRDNVGKKICYVDYIEPYRGTYFVRYGRIGKLKHSTLFLDEECSRSVDIRNIKQIGIEV